MNRACEYIATLARKNGHMAALPRHLDGDGRMFGHAISLVALSSSARLCRGLSARVTGSGWAVCGQAAVTPYPHLGSAGARLDGRRAMLLLVTCYTVGLVLDVCELCRSNIVPSWNGLY